MLRVLPAECEATRGGPAAAQARPLTRRRHVWPGPAALRPSEQPMGAQQAAAGVPGRARLHQLVDDGGNDMPSASQSMGNMEIGVNPGMVFTSFTTISSSS